MTDKIEVDGGHTTEEILAERAAKNRKPPNSTTLAALIAAEDADATSEINMLRVIVDRCCAALDIANHDGQRNIVGDAILRGLWLGQGDKELALSPAGLPTSNVTAMPGVDLAAAVSNVVEANVDTSLDIPPEKLLRKAIAHDLDEVVILGWEKAGAFYIAASSGDAMQSLALVQLGNKRVVDALEEAIMQIQTERG